MRSIPVVGSVLFVVAVGSSPVSAATFNVSSTNPAAGSDITQPPTSITVDVNQTIDFSTVDVADLLINGSNASSFTQITPQEVSFQIGAGIIPANGVNSVSVFGFKDTFGDDLTPDSFTFQTDGIDPSVVSSNVQNGEVLPPGALTEVFTFSEPMNTAAVTASSFDLHGLSGADYAANSFSFDPTGTVLTLNYLSIPVGNYASTLFASGFADLSGRTLDNNFVVDFCTSQTAGCPISAVPEPMTLALLGVGLAGIGFVRRRA